MVGKWLDIEKDKDFHRLIERIEKNYAPPVSWVKDDLRILLRNRGYEWKNERVCKREVARIDLEVSNVGSKGRKPISDIKIAEIRKMRSEGRSVRFIANQLNVGKSTVSKYIK